MQTEPLPSQAVHPPTLPCARLHTGEGGVQMCRQDWVLLSQDRYCPLVSPRPFSLFSPFPGLSTCLSVQVPPTQGSLRASHVLSRGLHFTTLPDTQLAGSLSSEGALEIFQLCLYVPRAWEDKSMSHPLPGLLILLQITGRTF